MPQQDWIKYQRILDFLRLRKRAYQFTFGRPEDNEALKDLARFAHIGKAPFHPNQRLNDILIGRQEMFFRIIDHLKLSPDELHQLYSKPSTIQPKGE